MIGSFVEFHARDRKISLTLDTGDEFSGRVGDVADDGGWLVLEQDDGRRLFVNAARIKFFEVLEV